MTISNKYKNTLDNLIDSLDKKSSNWPRPIDKKSDNASRSESSLTKLLKRNIWIKIS